MQLKAIKKLGSKRTNIYLISDKTAIEQLPLNDAAAAYVQKMLDQEVAEIVLNADGKITIIACFKQKEAEHQTFEGLRMLGAEVTKRLNKLKLDTAAVSNETDVAGAELYFAEGAALANYQFLKYKKEAAKEQNAMRTLEVVTDEAALSKLTVVIEGVCKARDLINEPLITLTAPQLAEEAKKAAKEAGFKITVFKKSRIEREKMGGLLAVNSGSIDPPTFSILEWKPKNAVNKKPIVLVGKGVVYDTGGLSLKPTVGMDIMKCDMGGAAAVIGALYSTAKNKLPVHVIGLVPATDNRPGGNAYTPGDVIRMHSGATVEVLNTDAEGRMILADALSYAKKYKPELVIDICTLTGAALVTISNHGMLLMGTDEAAKAQLKSSSFHVYERLAELPLWDEFKEQLRSDIADVKNIGGRHGGSITAAKFLQHFVDFPWCHIDMAPMGWNASESGYRLKGGSGAGVRLFYDFLANRAKSQAE